MTGNQTAPESLLAVAEGISTEVLARWAGSVDRENRFPTESVEAIRAARLLGYFIPRRLGGIDGDMATYCRIAATLGSECLSSAMIWVMHAHQVAVIVDHGNATHEEYLADIAAHGKLLASVTSEYGGGGDVLRAESPLLQEGAQFRLTRKAPVVSYGEQAGYYLITMRAGPDRPGHDARLVLVSAAQPGCTVAGGWHPMGLKGTRSIPMQFDLLVDPGRIVGSSFRQAVLMTLAPAAHIGWSAAWFGAANGVFNRFINLLRKSHSPRLGSESFLRQLARLRVSLDLTRAMLDQVTLHYDQLRKQQASFEHYEDLTFNIASGNLKIAASESLFNVVNELVELAGMHLGYLENDELGLERVFRDLRSASLMYSNERLLLSNGRLLLVESSDIKNVWLK